MQGCGKEAINSHTNRFTRRQFLQIGALSGLEATIGFAGNSKSSLIDEAKSKLTDILDEEAKVIDVKPKYYKLLTSIAYVINDLELKTTYKKREIINILDWIDGYTFRAGLRPSEDNKNLITNALKTKKVDCDTSLLNIHCPIISTIGIDFPNIFSKSSKALNCSL